MRIITGKAKGCQLKTPKGMSTRPTSDRVKESLFSILGNEVEDVNVLDVFAGTGGLGLEALSRGAKSAVFVDKSTADIIKDNLRHCHLEEQGEVMKGDVFTAMQRLAGQGRSFELVFCDPPYHLGLWQRTMTYLAKSSLLSTGGLLVVECGGDENEVLDLPQFKLLRKQKYGHTTQINIYEMVAIE